MIDIRTLQVYLSGKLIVEAQDLGFESGSIHAILGPNGCGKTTFLKGIGGLYKQESYMTINQEFYDPNSQSQDYIAGFFDGGAYYSNLTVRDNLNYARLLFGLEKTAVDEVLQLIDFPTAQEHSKASKLSLGQKQKLGLAMVLLLKRPLVLLDEPFNGLDRKAVDGLFAVLERIKVETGSTILLSSHLIPDLEARADHLTILKEGQVVLHEPMSRFLAKAENGFENAYKAIVQ